MGRVVGIDLGTTFSLIAYLDAQTGAPKCIPGPYGSTLCPSVVSVDRDGKVIVGEPARAKLLTQPERTIYSVKRLMGRGVADVQDELKIFPFRIDPGSDNVIRVRLGDKSFTAPEISAYILRELKSWADAYFKEPVDRAVITVPAYFNDAQRQATKDAGRLAGLEVLRLVNEPTAAALAYGLHKQKRGHVAVYDFGGGTFDISTSEADRTNEGDIYQVLATNGDTHLGGDDIDNALLALTRCEIREKFRRGFRIIAAKPFRSCAKPDIARSTSSLQRGKNHRCSFRWNRTGEVHPAKSLAPEFDELIRPIIARTMAPVKLALADAKLAPKEMDEVVLVGGSTRIPLVRKTVGDYFRRAPHCELNPDEVVALGAAVQADILETGVKTMLLLDVTPLSLGHRDHGRGDRQNYSAQFHDSRKRAGTVSPPASRIRPAIDVHVLQGERELAKDCRSLARFQLKTPPGPGGLARIEVKFLIDANGILQVAARDLRTETQHTVEVQPSYGLSRHRDRTHARGIDRVRRAGFCRAPGDRSAYRSGDDSRRDGQGAAERRRSRKSAAAEREVHREIGERVAHGARRQDYKLMRQRIDEIEPATTHLAEVLMNGALQSAFEGKRLDDV